jgi:hypothetical protein
LYSKMLTTAEEEWYDWKVWEPVNPAKSKEVILGPTRAFFSTKRPRMSLAKMTCPIVPEGRSHKIATSRKVQLNRQVRK